MKISELSKLFLSLNQTSFLPLYLPEFANQQHLFFMLTYIQHPKTLCCQHPPHSQSPCVVAYLTAHSWPTNRPHSAVGPTRSIDPARCQASAQRGREKRSRVFACRPNILAQRGSEIDIRYINILIIICLISENLGTIPIVSGIVKVTGLFCYHPLKLVQTTGNV